MLLKKISYIKYIKLTDLNKLKIVKVLLRTYRKASLNLIFKIKKKIKILKIF